MNGNLDELRLHIAALKRMVEMRGGLQALSSTRGVLRMFITWSASPRPSNLFPS